MAQPVVLPKDSPTLLFFFERKRCAAPWGGWAGQSAAAAIGGVDAPFGEIILLRLMREEFGDVETDAARTDDRHRLADRRPALDDFDIAHDLRVADPGMARVRGVMSVAQHDMVEARQILGDDRSAQFQGHAVAAGDGENSARSRRRLPCRKSAAPNRTGRRSRSSDRRGSPCAPFGQRRGAGHAGRTGADHGDGLGRLCRPHLPLGLAVRRTD